MTDDCAGHLCMEVSGGGYLCIDICAAIRMPAHLNFGEIWERPGRWRWWRLGVLRDRGSASEALRAPNRPSVCTKPHPQSHLPHTLTLLPAMDDDELDITVHKLLLNSEDASQLPSQSILADATRFVISTTREIRWRTPLPVDHSLFSTP